MRKTSKVCTLTLTRPDSGKDELNFQLKNIDFSEARSHDSNCYIANMHVTHMRDGKKLGSCVVYCEDDGWGGETMTSFHSGDKEFYKNIEELLRKTPDFWFEAYCKEHGYNFSTKLMLSYASVANHVFECYT